ncbi:MAG: hypothetical protein PUE89_06825 [Lachnospiraceae bacterium]|nr:hypothetical protein [Lachnospiraceae bacterium]
MANKNLLKSKAVLKAISIGLAAMMAMTPVVGATDVYADDVDGNEPESNESNISESQSESSENNTQSSENNTQAVEESYEQAKKDLVPEIPQDATVTTDTTDGVTTEKTEFTETSENVKTDITVEKTTSEDGNSEDIKVKTNETTTESEETTEYEYTYNNETVTVTKEEYAQKIAESKAGKDLDGKDLVFTQSEPSTEDILDESGVKIGEKKTITEEATFIDEEGYETTKTITTTVITYINSEITAPNAPTPADPDKISLGEATDNSSSTAVLPDGTIIIETSEKKASAYKSEKSESEAATTVNNKVSEETVEIKSSGKKTETISSFNTEAEANEMLDTLEDKDKESVSVVKEDGTFKLVKTVYVQVDEPEDITVQSGDGVAEFDILVNSKYSESDGWKIVKSETDEVSGTTTWTVTKTVGDLTTKYTYKFTPEKRNETAPESSVTTSAKTADEFAKNHLSEYTAENSGWTVSKNTDGNTTIWTISKKDGDTTTQYTYKFTVTESTSTATKTSVKTNATTNEGFLAELKDNYKDGISNGSVTITDNNDGTYTVVKKGANSYETITETYTYSSSSVVTIPEVTAATWNEFVNAFEGNKNASIDELNKKCTVTTKSEAGTTIITYTFSEGKPVTSEVETVTTTSLNASDFEAELKKQFAGWEFSNVDTTSRPGYAVWKVAKSENGTKTEYEYSFKYESENAKPYTPTAKDEESFKNELINSYGEANVSISSKEVDGVTTTTYTCTKVVDGLTQTYVYTSKTVAEKADKFYTTATSVGEFKKIISEKYPGYNFVYDEKIHDKKGNAADQCKCTVTKDGKTVAIYEYWVSPDSGHNSGKHNLKGQTIDEFLKDKYKETDGWTVEKIDDNKWKASRPQNDNHTHVQIITLNGATEAKYTDKEIADWVNEIKANHKSEDGWTVTKDGDNNKWVAVKTFGRVTIDEVVYELTENGTTKSVTRKVEKSTLSEILGDEVFSENAPVVNASNYQAYTLISAGDAIIDCHENGGVYAGGEIGTKNEDGTFNKDGEVNIDDWFGAVLYDKDGTINLQNSDNQNRIERKKVDKTSDEIKKYWSGVADSVIKSCDSTAQKIIDGVYKVKEQVVANYDEWLKSVTINSWEKAFDKFMTALNDCGALLTGNKNGFQPAQDGSGETGNSNLVIVSRTSDKITVSNGLGNLNLGLLLAPDADIEVAGNNFTGTLIGNNIVNNAQSHTNIRSEKITKEETKKVGKSVTVEQYKVNAKQKLAEMVCTLSDPKVVANREKTEVSSTVDAKGITFSASMESSKTTLNVNALSKTDTITDSKLEKAKEGIKKETLDFEKEFKKSSSEKLGSKVTSKTTITNKKSVVILGKKVSETGTRVVTPPPTTPPVTPPPTTPPTTPPPTTPPTTPPSITPPTPVTPDTPTEGVLGERREVSPDAAVLGARRRVLGARRGVLGEKRVLGARTEDTSNAAGAVGVMLGSVALSGVWMTLRRKKKIQ